MYKPVFSLNLQKLIVHNNIPIVIKDNVIDILYDTVETIIDILYDDQDDVIYHRIYNIYPYPFGFSMITTLSSYGHYIENRERLIKEHLYYLNTEILFDLIISYDFMKEHKISLIANKELEDMLSIKYVNMVCRNASISSISFDDLKSLLNKYLNIPNR